MSPRGLIRGFLRAGLRRTRHTPRPPLSSAPRIWTLLVALYLASTRGLIRGFLRAGLRRMRHTPRPPLSSAPRIWTLLVALYVASRSDSWLPARRPAAYEAYASAAAFLARLASPWALPCRLAMA